VRITSGRAILISLSFQFARLILSFTVYVDLAQQDELIVDVWPGNHWLGPPICLLFILELEVGYGLLVILSVHMVRSLIRPFSKLGIK